MLLRDLPREYLARRRRPRTAFRLVLIHVFHSRCPRYFGFRPRQGRELLQRFRILAFGGPVRLGVNAVHQRVLDFVGIAQDVGRVEADDLRNIFHAIDVAVRDTRLDGVLDGVIGNLLLEDPRQCRRAHLERSIQRAPVDGAVDRRPNARARWVQPLRVVGVAQPDLRTEAPVADMQRQRHDRMHVEPAHQRAGHESRFPPRHALRRRLVRPVQRRLPDLSVHAARIEAGRVQDGDHIAAVGALEILVARRRYVERVSVVRLRHEHVRPHLGIHRQRECFRERQPEDERTQVFHVDDAPKPPWQPRLAVHLDVRAALVHVRRTKSAVEHTEIGRVQIRILARLGAKFTMLRPSAVREVLRPGRRVHAAIDRPVHRLAQDGALARRLSDRRDQQSALPSQPVHRVLRVWKVEDRHPEEPEVAVIHPRLFADIDRDLLRVECPLRLGQFATGHHAVGNDVAAAVFLHHVPGKEERVRRRQHHVAAAEVRARRAFHVVEAPRLRVDVDRPVRRLEVLVMRPAVERQVAGSRQLARFRVVRDFVRPHLELAERDYHPALEAVHVARFFLEAAGRRLDRDFLALFPRPSQVRLGFAGLLDLLLWAS